MHTLGGTFNRHFVYQGQDGHKFLRRKSLTIPEWREVIKKNNKQWGFEQDGANVVVRTEDEICELAVAAHEAGLRVPPIIKDGKGGTLTPYLENAVTLDKYLPTAPGADAERTLTELISDLSAAHSKGIVYGDRWYNNILVDPALGVVNIDFDLKPEGPGKELDLAQVIYYSIAFDKDRSPATLVSVLKRTPLDYNLALVKKFMDTKEAWSRDKYGDLRIVIDTFFNKLKKE